MAAETRVERVLAQLRDGGGRVTSSRRVVVEALFTSSDHHLTAREVADAAQRVAPDLHESTVYRILDRLAELGVVQRLELGAGAVVFHVASSDHHHLLCDGCGAVLQAEGDLLDEVADRVRRDHGFSLRSGVSTLRGRCAACTDRHTRVDGGRRPDPGSGPDLHEGAAEGPHRP